MVARRVALRAPWPARIVVFGATGYTGRLVAERLVGPGERPVLAGRDGGAAGRRWRSGSAAWRPSRPTRCARTRCSRCVERGRRLISTVGPFAKWGEPAVRAAIAAGATYLDSTGEPAFIRRVFEEFGGAGASATGAALLTAMGYDFVPGALAGALALRARPAPDAVRVDVGYYSLGDGRARGQRRHARVARRRDARRRASRSATGAMRARARGRARALVHVKGKERAGDLGRRRGALRRCPPPTRGCARSTSTSAGSARWRAPLQAGALAGSSLLARARACARRCRRPASGWSAMASGPEAGTTPATRCRGSPASRLRRGRRAAGRGPRHRRRRVRLHRRLPGLGGARRAAGPGVDGTGALGPVEAFGLDELERGCAEAGLSRLAA